MPEIEPEHLGAKALNILLITSFFPPQNETGARRPYHLATALVHAGHKVTVVACTCLTSVESWNVDLSQFQMIRPSSKWPDARTPVHQRIILWLCTRFSSGLAGKLSRTLSFLLLPLDHTDHGAIDVAEIVSKVDQPDVVIASGPWWSSLLLGSRIARSFDHPVFIMDYRDPWITVRNDIGLRMLTWYGTGPIAALKKWRAVRAEKKASSNATAITTVSEALLDNMQRSTGLFVGKVVMNGFETNVPEAGNVQYSTRQMVLTYTGRMYDEQPWGDLLDGIDEFINSCPAALGKFKVRIFTVGTIPTSLSSRLMRFQERGVVELLTKQPRHVVLHAQRTSDALLSLGFGELRGILPIKNLEYLGARRPVVHMNAIEADIEHMLERTNSGTVDSTSHELAQRLSQLFEDWQKDGALAFNGNESIIARYSAEARMAEYVQFVEELTAAK